MKTRDPHSYADTSQGRIRHIDFEFQIDFSARTIQGNAHYYSDKPLRGSFFLDCRDVKIHQIFSGSQDLDWELDLSDPILGSRLHLKDLNGISSFSVTFTPGDEASALQWLAPEQTAGGEHPFLYSQCAPIHARSIFPCQDTPSVRFTYSAEIEVPVPLAAVMAAASTGEAVERKRNLYRFEMPQPIPSYLFALAVGDITSRDIGPRCRVYAEPQMIEEAAWEFAETEANLTQAERLFGPYLWDRYDILVMPPSFPAGAMENPRLSFFSPTTIVGDRSETWGVAHELAHAWTGNLVTNATWDDVWLNEGWTTYADWRITKSLRGRDYAQLAGAIRHNALLADMKRLGMESDQTRLKFSRKGAHPDDFFTPVAYIKGCFFVLTLERCVGRKAFDDFISTYISRFSFQSLTTEEFVDFLKGELPQVKDQMDTREWLYDTGLPSTAPTFSSSLYDDVARVVTAYNEGRRPTKQDVAGWLPLQRLLFLQMLPEQIPADDCRHIEALFDLKSYRNVIILSWFYALAIRSGYRDVLRGVERFMQRHGRPFFLNRVMRSLVQADWTRQMARPLFESLRPRYHPITQGTLERTLSEAGL